MTELQVDGGAPLRGTIRVPGDKSISHRALLLAARAEGTSVLRGLSGGDDVRRTRAIVEELGAQAVDTATGLEVSGGWSRLSAPAGTLDVGNSGTALRLVAGYVAAFDWTVTLAGDDSIAARPMDRVAAPLSAMGATVTGQGPRCLPPVTVTGGGLRGIDYQLPVASAQVKSAVLLAGLGAEGDTVVREPEPTRVHTEELLAAAGGDIDWRPGWARVRPGPLRPLDLDVPGDPSQAAFWVVAACITPGSEVTVDHVYVGQARDGFLRVLERMGADIEITRTGPTTASITARHSALRATTVTAAEVPGLVDEIPVLAVAAATADGVTVFEGAGELRVKETDRIATVTSELGALGARVEGAGDVLTVAGGGSFRGGRAESHGDHRIAMSAAVAGLSGSGTTTIAGWDCVATSYPGFADHLEELTR